MPFMFQSETELLQMRDTANRAKDLYISYSTDRFSVKEAIYFQLCTSHKSLVSPVFCC